jgi:hypothetical protein
MAQNKETSNIELNLQYTHSVDRHGLDSAMKHATNMHDASNYLLK